MMSPLTPRLPSPGSSSPASLRITLSCAASLLRSRSQQTLPRRVPQGRARLLTVFFLGLLSTLSAWSVSAEERLRWQLLGDVSVSHEHLRGAEPTFRLGDLDLMFQASPGERWQALGELMLMDMAEVGEPAYHMHPARAYIEYLQSDALRLRFGQVHTPIGLYSQLYPHGGKIFEMTIHRPKLVVVEHGKEILPLHSVGVMIHGLLVLSDTLELEYMTGLGNGGAHGGTDENLWKSPYLNLRLYPRSLEGLSFGASAYLDVIDQAHTQRYEELEQLILNAYLHYELFPCDLLIEGYWVQHQERGHHHATAHSETRGAAHGATHEGAHGADQGGLYGGFGQLSYSVGDHSPFVMVEYFKRARGDLLLSEHTPYVEYLAGHAGHRYYFSPQVLLKSGYRYEWYDQIHRFDLQLAFQLQ